MCYNINSTKLIGGDNMAYVSAAIVGFLIGFIVALCIKASV